MDSSKEQALRESVIGAQQTLEKARVDYQRAFEILADTGVNDDGMFALRREGQAYDQSVQQYTNAVMAWLTFGRQHFRPGPLNPDAKTLIASAIRDFERKRAEEVDLTAIVEASDDAIIGKTLDGTIVSWNRGAEKTYGYKAEEMLGRSISALIPPDKPNEFASIIKQLQRGQHIESYETTRIHKDGHLMDVSVTISPIKNKAGMIVGASVVGRDITKHKQAEAALRLSEARLQEALDEGKLMSGLLSICAWCKRIRDEHEIWQPMESYILAHSEAKFTHGLCPDCLSQLSTTRPR